MSVNDVNRNFKDFMLLYNELTESCFNACVAELGSRSLTPKEEECVSKCSDKHIRLNHAAMSVFMELQPAMMEKRQKETDAAIAAAIPDAQLLEHTSSSSTNEATTAST